MFLKRKCETDKPKKQYKATYKSLHSGNTMHFVITNPEKALANFLQESGDILEMYMLISVMPLNKTEYKF